MKEGIECQRNMSTENAQSWALPKLKPRGV